MCKPPPFESHKVLSACKITLSLCCKDALDSNSPPNYLNSPSYIYVSMHVSVILIYILRDPTTLLGCIWKLAITRCKGLRLFPYAIDMIVGWLGNKNL